MPSSAWTVDILNPYNKPDSHAIKCSILVGLLNICVVARNWMFGMDNLSGLEGEKRNKTSSREEALQL